MKTKTLIMSISLLLAFMSQAQEHVHIQRDDTLTVLASPTGTGIRWNFTSINFSNYPNQPDSDLVQLSDPNTVYLSGRLTNYRDVATSALPTKIISQGGKDIIINGNYTMENEGRGKLELPGFSFSEIDKIKVTETYSYVVDDITSSSYTNIYYVFFDRLAQIPLLSIYKKQRLSNTIFGWNYVGINYCALTINNPNAASILLALVPNPASDQTQVSFRLDAPSDVEITISNQAGTVNDNIFSGQGTTGLNTEDIDLTRYQAGLYTVTVLVGEKIYAVSLIVN